MSFLLGQMISSNACRKLAPEIFFLWLSINYPIIESSKCWF